MGKRKSSIETLPEDILSQLQALLLDPRVTQLQVTHRINDLLEKQGSEDRVSKSAVNRYAISFEELTAESLETERLASMMLKELKIDNQSTIGQATAEMLRVMLFRILPVLKSAMVNEELDLKELQAVTGMINTLATSHEKMERSATENEKRKRDIEKAATLKANEKAAETMAKTAKLAGVSEETINRIRIDVLGMSDG